MAIGRQAGGEHRGEPTACAAAAVLEQADTPSVLRVAPNKRCDGISGGSAASGRGHSAAAAANRDVDWDSGMSATVGYSLKNREQRVGGAAPTSHHAAHHEVTPSTHKQLDSNQ
eukprot:m.380957 g.380957  ORF g.380957 m.380957 type:complete len:114 (+) comp16713_c3_seq8:471-812(+)